MAAPTSALVVNTEHASAQYYRDVLELVLRRLGWVEERGRPSARAHVIWWDEPIRRPHFLALPPTARVNRFYAMVRICRKVCLARLLDFAGRLYPEEYAHIAPETWWVGQPSWAAQLRAHRQHCETICGGAAFPSATPVAGCKGMSLAATACCPNPPAEQPAEGAVPLYAESAFIVKPDNGCQGAGIRLVRGHAELCALLRGKDAPPRAVVQCYLPDPMLLSGFKFDLRLYVIITRAAPLRAYLSRRGVARFATHTWHPVSASNQHDTLMHLSNSSINQLAQNKSNKRGLPALWRDMERVGIDSALAWRHITRLVGLTIAAMAPAFAHAHATAFHGVTRTGGRGVRDAGGPALASSTGRAFSPAELDTCGGLPPVAPSRCFQILGLDVMLDASARPWIVEANHSPSMAISGADEDETEAKAAVVAAALRLSTAGETLPSLVEQCHCEPLHKAADGVSVLQAARVLFERCCTGRAAQQWLMAEPAFSRLMARAGVDEQTARSAAVAARLVTEDFGHGWDPPPPGSLNYFGFVEALLALALGGPAGAGQPPGGLAAALERLISCATAAADASVKTTGAAAGSAAGRSVEPARRPGRGRDAREAGAGRDEDGLSARGRRVA